jgi:hypothetical protein
MNSLISALESLGSTLKTQPAALIFCFWYAISASVISLLAFSSGDAWGAIDIGISGSWAGLLYILLTRSDAP